MPASPVFDILGILDFDPGIPPLNQGRISKSIEALSNVTWQGLNCIWIFYCYMLDYPLVTPDSHFGYPRLGHANSQQGE